MHTYFLNNLNSVGVFNRTFKREAVSYYIEQIITNFKPSIHWKMIFRTEWIEGARFLSKMLYEHHNCSGETYTKPANIRKQNGPNYQKNILWSDFSWTINNLGKPNILIPTAYLSCVNWSLSLGSLLCNCNKKKIYKCNPRLSRLIISQVWVVNIVWSLFAIMPFHTFLVDCIYLLDCEFSDTGYDITDLGIYAASMPLFEFMGKICRITLFI